MFQEAEKSLSSAYNLKSIDEEWYPVVRYDTAHGKPHRDILRPNGEQTKDWFEGYSVEDVLTIGQKDIMDNWPAYRDRLEMKR